MFDQQEVQYILSKPSGAAELEKESSDRLDCRAVSKSAFVLERFKEVTCRDPSKTELAENARVGKDEVIGASAGVAKSRFERDAVEPRPSSASEPSIPVDKPEVVSFPKNELGAWGLENFW